MAPQRSLFELMPDPGVLTRDPDWQAKALVAQAVPPDLGPSSVPGFTADELTALESLAASLAPSVDWQPPVGAFLHGRRWDRWISEGALTQQFRLPMIQHGRGADILVITTRLGWTGGYRYRAAEGGGERGNTVHPSVDSIGRFYLTTREAAAHEGAHLLYQDQAHSKFGDLLKAHFLGLGLDVTTPVPDDAKRRVYDFASKGIPHA